MRAARPPFTSMSCHISARTSVDCSPFRIAETLSDEVLAKMHAPPKPDYPIIKPTDLRDFDAYMLGIPTRYGNFPAQWKVIRSPVRFVVSES